MSARPGRRRVLVLVNDLIAGGAQRAALDQAAILDRTRYQVELASLELEAGGRWAGDRFRHVPIRRLREPGQGWGSAWFGLMAALRRFEPELVHCHLVASGILGAIGARIRRVPRVVTTFHNLSDWEAKRHDPLRVMGRQAARRCDATIAVSQAVRAAVERVDPRMAGRLHVIPNGIDLAPFRDAARQRAASRARRGFAPGDFVVGAVARFDPRKGLDLLLEAVAIALPKRPEIRVLLVGDGPERGFLEAQAEALALGRVVRFVGERTDVRFDLAAMDLFAAPSRSEGLGVALIEALAAGVPVVGARVGGIPEVVEDEACGLLVEPGSPERLAEAILRLAGSKPELARLARRAPERAAVFSIESTRWRLERLYDTLLEPLLDRAAA